MANDPEQQLKDETGWERCDCDFFRAGACHVLAHVFLENPPEEGFSACLIRPKEGEHGFHVFVYKGDCAFDWRGYCSREALIQWYVANRKTKGLYDPVLTDFSSPLVTDEFRVASKLKAFEEFPQGVKERALKFLLERCSPPHGATRVPPCNETPESHGA